MNAHFSNEPTKTGSWEGSRNGSPLRWEEDRRGEGDSARVSLTPRDALAVGAGAAGLGALIFLP